MGEIYSSGAATQGNTTPNTPPSTPPVTPEAVSRPGHVSAERIRSIVGNRGSESLLSTFATFPTKVCFETQDDAESVVLFLRAHPIITVPWIILAVIMLAIPSVFGFFPPFALLHPNYQFIVTLGWYLFVFGYSLSKFMSWYFDIYIITDERVVDVDFEDIFFRKISTARLTEIQDVNVIANSAFATFFGFGTVFMQTAAKVSEFAFINVPHPDVVGKILNEMVDVEETEHEGGNP